MKYAIDKLVVGKEREVDADEFDGEFYIPYRQTRFFCPECGETVYFRSKWGNNPNLFYHQEKNEKTPECDKRVDSYTFLSLYQKIGLPLYLTGLVYGDFRLNVGFPALGEDVLQKTSERSCFVEISGGKESKSVKIDYVNFIADGLTLVPIGFIPQMGSNYLIKILCDEEIYGIKRCWAEYADGFEKGGAIFCCDENGGRKIRRGDSISTYKKYLAITKSVFPHLYDEIKINKVGSINLGRNDFCISEIMVEVSVENENVFRLIDNYLKAYFGVSLLVKQPELIPVWPPFIKTDCYSPVIKRKATCVVSSGNDDPRVFTYRDSYTSRMMIIETKAKSKVVQFDVQESPITVSVDRKYVGREIVFHKRSVPESCHAYNIMINNSSDEAIPIFEVSKEKIINGFSLSTEDKIELYLGLYGEVYKHYQIRDIITIIPSLSSLKKLIVVAESFIVANLDFSKVEQFEDDDVEILESIKRAATEPLIVTPLWVHGMIRRLLIQKSYKLAQTIMSVSRNGYISSEVIKILQHCK